MKKETHKTRLLEYLQNHKSITSLQAIQDLGNTRLSATIHTLRREGYDVPMTMVDVPNRWGGKTSVARYTLGSVL
jgi:hypothetical protein